LKLNEWLKRKEWLRRRLSKRGSRPKKKLKRRGRSRKYRISSTLKFKISSRKLTLLLKSPNPSLNRPSRKEI
jgi:hypothetical protein